MHRDLKLENIIIEDNKENNGYVLKLCDFGCACQYFSEKRKTLCGTPECKLILLINFFILDIPPEMADGIPYEYSVDIWSLGIIAYEIITGYSPFSGSSTEETFSKIKNYDNISNLMDHLREFDCSEEVVDFLSKLLVPDPSKRMTIEEVVVHPWIIKNIN